jgi:hypothetical protein
MKIYLGISQKELPAKMGEAYGCISKKDELINNDVFLLYVKRQGVSQIFSIEPANNRENKLDCDMRGMKTAWLSHILTLDKPLTIEQMRSHENIRNLDAVKKNFQMTTSIVKEDIFIAIIEYLIKLNPAQEKKLRSLIKSTK